MRVPLVFICAVLLRGGVFGAWIAESGFILALGLALVLRFRAGHWRTVEL
jgi:hypothetical protein